VGREDRQRERIGALLENKSDDEDDHHRDLRGQQEHQDACSDVDFAVAEEPDQDHRDHGKDRPIDRPPEGRVQKDTSEVSDPGHIGQGDGVVCDDRDERRRNCRRLAQPACDVLVEASCAAHPLAHRRVADREEEQHHTRDDERSGRGRTAADREAQGMMPTMQEIGAAAATTITVILGVVSVPRRSPDGLGNVVFDLVGVI
jgi:hypothetical protein